MDAFFNRVWARRGLAAWLLWPLSLLFGGLVVLRRMAYAAGLIQTHQLPVPVLVVGNVRVGGGGKSPTVLAVVRHLHGKGLRLAVVSRGYGRRAGASAVLEVRPGMDVQDCGDEPLMLVQLLAQWSVPVFVGTDRVQAGRAALTAYPGTQVLVCDDGLQHLALGRDVEIVVHPAAGSGNGFLLPAGPLREPWPRRADAVLNTASCRSLADVASDAAGRTVALSALAGCAVVAVAAIAQPQAFFDMLRAKGVRLVQTLALPDHDDFSGWDTLKKELPGGACILCTEKDAVKLWTREPAVLAVPMRLDPPAAFFDAIDRKLATVMSR